MKDRLSVREMFALQSIELPKSGADCDIPFPCHVASDSRDVQAGGVFVALEGERVDGHDFIMQAAENGAVLVVGRKGKCPASLPVPYVGLDEPERQLGEVAARYVEYAAPREIVAVTGSVGKTTTREAIRRVLEGKYKLHSAVRSFNTVIGCSSTILAMPLGTEILLLEFGANSMGEIRNLTRLFPPTVALVTQVAPVHLAGFGSLEGVLEAKMEIVESDQLKSFVYDGDSLLLREAVLNLPLTVRACGVGRNSGEYRVSDTEFKMGNDSTGLSLEPVLTFNLEGRQDRQAFKTGVWGEKLAMPVAMGAVVGHLLGLSFEECAAALRSFVGLKGRGRVVPLAPTEKGGRMRRRFVIDDAYNANPISMRSSLETYLSLKLDAGVPGKKSAVLGDMRELGENEVQFHKNLLPLVERLDRVIFVGGDWKRALEFRGKKAWSFVEKWQEAAELLEKDEEWDALLVKGSNSLRLEELVHRIAGEPLRAVDGGSA